MTSRFFSMSSAVLFKTSLALRPVFPVPNRSAANTSAVPCTAEPNCRIALSFSFIAFTRELTLLMIVVSWSLVSAPSVVIFSAFESSSSAVLTCSPLPAAA
ncbi:Uncharacterised protein [Mycobacteroides abscessus subsp. abscessus]|nr:Uncharacterised protein [Mycobacteroides abscessus subsp. abscessus]